MMNVNTEVWGSAFTQLDSINTRTGAADLSDPDYTNFPPFVRNNLSILGDTGNPAPTYFENDSIYIGYLNLHGLGAPWTPGADIDKTIVYCACVNTDLTIYNTIIVGTGKYDSIISDDFNFIIPNQDKAIAAQRTGGVVPIFFKNGETYFRHKPNKGVYPLDGRPYLPFYNPASSSHPTQKMYMWTPDGLIDETSGYSTSTERAKVNNNAYMSYWRDFGIRTIFGVIKLIYFDGTYSQTNGIPQNVVQNPVSLHWYETQTDEWKAGHPILGAFLDIYFRRNTDGTYTAVKPSNMCFTAEISNGLELVNADKWGDNVGAKLWQPTQSLRDGCNSFFPLFGDEQLGARIDTSITGTVQIGTQLTTSGNNGVSQTGGCLVGYQAKSWLHSGQRYSGSSMTPYKTMWLEMEGTSENLELLRRSAAAYGLFFADDEYNLADAGRDESRWTDSNMCLGVVDNNGFTDGTYTRGTNNTTANNWEWKKASESRYDPDRPPPSPDNQYSRETIFNHIGDLASLTKRYVLSGSFVELLGEQLYNITYTLTDQDQDYTELENKIKSEFLVTNPIDCIIDLRRYPMQIPSEPDLVHLMLGRYDTGLNVYELARPCQTYLFELSSPIYPLFGDSFLDYSPWTSFELYVPFCGTVRLNPEDILGNQLAVQLVVDFTTGTCTGFIQSDDLVIETVTGTLGIDIPVSGIQAVTAASQLNNAILNKKEAKTSQVFQALNIVKGVSNPIGYMEGVIQKGTETQRADYNLQHTEAPVHVIGTSSPLTSWAIDLNCRLICYYPTSEEMFYIQNQIPRLSEVMLQRYGHIEGFATVEVNSIGSHTGLVIATDVNTQGISCTDEEREMIRSALSEGCYV